MGAGVAGLAAAFRLAREGLDVTVFERQERVGGRAYTLRGRFPQPLTAEAGPARFPPSCRRVRGYARQLGLPICAVPLSALGGIRFDPPLDRSRVHLARRVPFSSAVRVFLQMSRAYWRDGGCSGFAVTDTVGEVWAPRFRDPERPALLVCYAKGALADALGSLPRGDLIAHTIERLEAIFPDATEHFESGSSFSWKDQPWIRGGWPLVRDGFADRVAVFQRPVGRVSFVDDYATTTSGCTPWRGRSSRPSGRWRRRVVPSGEEPAGEAEPLHG